jgi:nucleotide-binding universal stress UspA family protein
MSAPAAAHRAGARLAPAPITSHARAGAFAAPLPRHARPSPRRAVAADAPAAPSEDAAAAGRAAVAAAVAAAAAAAPALPPRRVVFAVDGTPGCEAALAWAARELLRPSDEVTLAHVLCDARTPSTAVGSSAAATQWSPARAESAFARAYFGRAEAEAEAMLRARFLPALGPAFAATAQLALPRLREHVSAAGIGAALSDAAAALGADLLVVASHGPGVLAEYGSVARWASENSRVPALLVPPEAAAAPPGATRRAVVVSAPDDDAALRRAFDYALAHVARPGDAVYVLHARGAPDEAAAAAERRALVAAVARWQEESEAPGAETLNVAVELVLDSASSDPDRGSSSSSSGGSSGSDSGGPDSGDEMGAHVGRRSAAGARVCEAAEALGARAVVAHHHGRSVMRGLQFAPFTGYLARSCTRPLIVLGAAPAEGAGKPERRSAYERAGAGFEPRLK